MQTRKKVRSRKAQSALEFLTTYGWAFLVILVMIGAMQYFVVLDVTRFLPDKCGFKAGIGCREFIVYSSDSDVDPNSIHVVLINNFGKKVTVLGGSSNEVLVQGLSNFCESMTMSMADDIGAQQTIFGPSPTDVDWEANEHREFVIRGCTIAPGERAKTLIKIAYQPVGTPYTKILAGEIGASAQ